MRRPLYGPVQGPLFLIDLQGCFLALKPVVKVSLVYDVALALLDHRNFPAPDELPNGPHCHIHVGRGLFHG